MFLERFRLDGKTAFITGGGRGIGLSTAEALAEAGARVTISDMDPQVLEAGRDELKRKGHQVEAVQLDVTDSKAVAAAARSANERHGAVDILIANAGIAWPDTGGEDMSDDVWLKVIDVDLNGAYWSCREFARPMLERGRGAIVTLGSMSGLISNKPQRQVHYNTAKAAVHHMTRSLAGEWAERGVRINCVAPTYVDTVMSRGGFTDNKLMPVWMEMTPMKRVARPDEIAASILFLASDAASAMTGAVVVVDCGYTIW
ncbi:SDR family oxidoreductase [Mesorhizobium mediterraneum]|uniref:3-oxoacyl-ACP reductase n=1 Tax=Mesorhizobium mediterraneum TaxID=43617 RepID=A0AB36RDG1_9HYPH|nr:MULTISPECIES: SDR family oxidoreductase [Mesorhizobium]AZO64355.1 SDR family oxidoreductase [Mesorhizobium sp. M6A.T.Cr.TU.016.01.1.1]PAQ02966.1 3-oxoacyl-ACP reductase [Mesorhizobium mediterraneum]RVB78747.1 SDR family oxidoreductase [Mesorhizobium sp. M6A.T.Cr.TU.014.01.1.1]RWN36428.1 MAG: SDR family oxidoreductase [Mesorhizobium sp.]RWN44872.1 MAG: SDR family oxidoreductase [Mesorhizobium sp.]